MRCSIQVVGCDAGFQTLNTKQRVIMSFPPFHSFILSSEETTSVFSFSLLSHMENGKKLSQGISTNFLLCYKTLQKIFLFIFVLCWGAAVWQTEINVYIFTQIEYKSHIL